MEKILSSGKALRWKWLKELQGEEQRLDGAAQRGRLPGPGIRLDPASAPSLAHPLILWTGKNTALVAQNGIEMGHFET